jgi:hypothetical protein
VLGSSIAGFTQHTMGNMGQFADHAASPPRLPLRPASRWHKEENVPFSAELALFLQTHNPHSLLITLFPNSS